MGSNFLGRKQKYYSCNRKEKYFVQRFIILYKKFASLQSKIKANQIEKFLSAFIGEKLIEKEMNISEYQLSDDSLSKLIKNQKILKRK